MPSSKKVLTKDMLISAACLVPAFILLSILLRVISTCTELVAAPVVRYIKTDLAISVIGKKKRFVLFYNFLHSVLSGTYSFVE